ncbi:DUF1763-domain-containing protein [Dothidotthia symphoricarpi CBS 119687]|uniref:DUF1763-domain-containing protein n=1 Tax=Dothidotthia symphoricarpi CBS 119687 TaxID=1392245 RepID=A0A6A6AD01_9PLEO|nr:DUF1763-domain-containing protein [Dothidotthia symphoricarpi CBS 119687]KAF2129650.1 DUF1763-domain-containing protein [Dothidotthia symphoricarpi CBS 119687]
MSSEATIRAYRHLYRHGLRAVQFSKPARYTLRDRLRLAFRKGSAVDFDALKIQTTLEFLRYAARENGLEHKILKNLLFVWWAQEKGGRSKPKARTLTREELEIKTTAFDTFNHTIRMLNESMGMCLPSVTVRDPN